MVQQVRPEPHHFLSLHHKEISFQMKVIRNCVISIAECWFFWLSLAGSSMTTIKSRMPRQALDFSLLISQSIKMATERLRLLAVS